MSFTKFELEYVLNDYVAVRAHHASPDYRGQIITDDWIVIGITVQGRDCLNIAWCHQWREK